MKPAGSERNMAANIDALRQNASRAGDIPGDRRGPLCPPRTRRAPVEGAWGSPWLPLIRAIKPSGPNAVAEPKFLLPVVVLPEPPPGEDSHGQADQRVAAAELHGRVHRERHIRRNPAPLSRRANLVRAGAPFVGIAFSRFWPPKASGGQWSRRLLFQAARRRSRGRPCAGADRGVGSFDCGGSLNPDQLEPSDQQDQAERLQDYRACEPNAERRAHDRTYQHSGRINR
jgi:hypothetical protein